MSNAPWKDDDLVAVKRSVVAAGVHAARKAGAANTAAALRDAWQVDALSSEDWQARAEAAEARKPFTLKRVAVWAAVPFLALYLLATGRKMGG